MGLSDVPVTKLVNQVLKTLGRLGNARTPFSDTWLKAVFFYV